MLLIVMVGALALAGLVSALVFRQTRRRTPPYDINDEWRAPWDSLHTEPVPPMGKTPMGMTPTGKAPIDKTWERPLRLSETLPRRAEPPIPRRDAARDPDRGADRNQEQDQTLADSRQIAAMLQRLARSTAAN
jgi:hypothetical protein